jgi:tetratricopeptide (TPR) repeat protein
MPAVSEQERQLVSQAEQMQEFLNHIEDLMANEDYERAQTVIRNAMRLEHQEPQLYHRYAFVLRMLDLGAAAELYEKVVMNPGDSEAYLQVAHSLLGARYYGAAINPLRRVLDMVPMAANTMFELGYCYLKEFDIDAAREYFDHAFELDPNLNTAYYVAYTALLQKDIATTKTILGQTEAQAATEGRELPLMFVVLKQQLERFEAFPPENIRDWHFVQYGTPLLRTSTEDIPEAGELNGRYVFINYGWLNIAIVLETLRRLIQEVPGFPQYQYVIPASRNAAPLAHAFAQMANIPMGSPDALNSEHKGLVFTTWTDEVDMVSQRIGTNPNVTLFSFALGWALQANLSPDIVGYLDQAHRMPWEETVEIQENGERTQRPAIELPIEVLGEHILDRVQGVEQAELDKVIAYYKERAHLLKYGENQNSPRLTFQTESPIPTIRMMV